MSARLPQATLWACHNKTKEKEKGEEEKEKEKTVREELLSQGNILSSALLCSPG